MVVNDDEEISEGEAFNSEDEAKWGDTLMLHSSKEYINTNTHKKGL